MARRISVGVVLSIVAIGCASATPPAVDTAAPAPASASAGASSLPWSVSRPLVWNDYRAPAPTEGVEGARTVYVLSYESRCRGASFDFRVEAQFLPDLSWVKPRVLEDPDERLRILQHERTHFDLTEVYARRMRKYFAELPDPCGLPEEQLEAAVDGFVRDEAEAQQRYDRDTEYGLVPEEQSRWDGVINGLLVSLDDFAPAAEADLERRSRYAPSSTVSAASLY